MTDWIAEILDEHNAEKIRVRNRRRNDRKHPENKAERNKNRMNRMYRLYGTIFEDGHDWYWENCKEGQKQSTEPDAEIFRNLKDAELERSAYAELIDDPEHRVGFSELDRIIYNADKYMRERRAEVAEDHKDQDVELFDHYCTIDGDVCSYGSEYYYQEACLDFAVYTKNKGHKMTYAERCQIGDMMDNYEINEWLKWA